MDWGDEGMGMARIWHLGLTGGIGSGKSTVAAMWRELGAAVIDADALSRSVTAVGGLAIDAIRTQFGQSMLSSEGAMDRDAMRALVFADPSARQRLEAIVHPLVSQLTQEQAQAATRQGHTCLVFDVPLLAESGARWRPWLDRVVVVDCEPQTQCQRVMARNGLARDEVLRIMGQQASRAQRLACADAVIFNEDLSLEALQRQVQALAASFGL